jgi:spermidine synthase
LIIIFSGNELSIGIILANWLIVEALGSYVAGRFAMKIKNNYIPYTILQWLLALIIPIVIYLTRYIPTFLDLIPGEAINVTTIFYVSILLLIPIGFINGAQFSFGCQLLSNLEKKGATLIGHVYSLEAVGSILGGAFSTYICLQYLNSIQTAFFLSFLNIISSLLLLYSISDKRNISYHKIIVLLKTSHLGLLVIILIMTISGMIDNLHKSSIEKLWPDYRIVAYNNSVYGNVTLLERAEQWHLLSNGVTIATLPVPEISQVEDIVHFPMLFHPNPKHIFLLGGGIAGIIDELLKYNISSIDYAELDPLLINTILKFAPDSTVSALKSNLNNTQYIDGRYYLRITHTKYDVIILNLPDPSTLVLNRFYTAEFFELCRSRLNINGLLIFQIPGSASYMNRPLAKLTNNLINTASQYFQFQRIIPFEKTFVILSNESSLQKTNLTILAERLRQRQVETKLFSELYLKYKLDTTRVIWFNAERERDHSVLLNSDLRPVALYYDLLYWNSSLSPIVATVYSWFEKIETIHWILLILICFLILVILRYIKKVPSDITILGSIFSTGFIGMGLTIIFILAFQALFGYIYYWIGLIIGAFMIGLAGGGIWASKKAKQQKNFMTLFFGLEGAITIYLLVILICLFTIQVIIKIDMLYSLVPYFILALNFICGSFVGAQFPIANKLYMKNQAAYTQTAGLIYASDLIGAWAGGILITLILIPIRGVIETTIILVVIKLGSTLFFRFSKV